MKEVIWRIYLLIVSVIKVLDKACWFYPILIRTKRQNQFTALLPAIPLLTNKWCSCKLCLTFALVNFYVDMFFPLSRQLYFFIQPKLLERVLAKFFMYYQLQDLHNLTFGNDKNAVFAFFPQGFLCVRRSSTCADGSVWKVTCTARLTWGGSRK